MRNQIFVLLACALACALGGNVVFYVPSPDCASPGGCDFNTSSLWTGPLNNQTELYISSNVSITLRLSGLFYSLLSLSFGQGDSAPVHIVMVDSSIEVPLYSDSIALQNLNWGNTSSFTLTTSNLVGSIVEGSSISLSEDSIFGAKYLFVDYLTAQDSSITGIRTSTIREAHVNNSLFINGGTFGYLYSNGTQFNSDVDITTLGVFTASTLSSYLTLMVNNATVSFYNTNLTCTVHFYDNATLSFYSDNQNQLQIPAIGGQGTIILGDNVVANFQQDINSIVLGNNVDLTLGQNSYTNMYVYNIQNNVGATIANVTVMASVYLASSTPLSAAIYIGESRSLTVDLTLQLAPGNLIYGPGLLLVNGLLDCSGSNISVTTVGYTAGIIKVDTLFTANLAPQIYSQNSQNSSTIIGNVVINTQYYGFDLWTNSFNITGDFTQIGGYVNFTIKNIPATTPLVTVGGAIVIKDVTFNSLIAIAVKNKENILLMRSLEKSLTLENSKIVHSAFTVELSSTITAGDLYMTVITKTGSNWFTKKRIIIISAVGGGVLACFIIIVACVARRSRRHHYHSVK